MKPLLAPLKEEWTASQGRGAVQPRTPFEYFVPQVRSHMRIVLSMDAKHTHFHTSCAANPALFSCCNVMWRDNWSEKSMHVVVQRQLTDVSDSTKSKIPQLLTSFHKSLDIDSALSNTGVTRNVSWCSGGQWLLFTFMNTHFFQFSFAGTEQHWHPT